MEGSQVASYTSLTQNANNSAMSATDDDNYGGYDSFDEQSYERPAERWAPLGAADVSPGTSQLELSRTSESDHLQQLEEEQEMLNNSLLSLTSHFAQVQFRLKQIVDAQPEDKETLLKDLEQFAFKGIPDMHGCAGLTDSYSSPNMSHAEHETRISEQRDKQRELITQLKSQLEDLELYAYQTGDAELPTSQVIEKQSVLIDQLRHKLDMNLEDFDKLSTDELKRVVDHAISRIVNPAIVKENLVEQLKTQIVDLERFIQFLHGEATPAGKEKCSCPVHDFSKLSPSHKSRFKSPDKKHNVSDTHVHQQTMSTMKKVLALLQIFAISQLGCGGREFQRNLLKRTAKGNHWGDLRAKLTLAVDKVIAVSKEQEEEREITLDSDCSSDSDEDGPTTQCDPALTQAVRRDLASALRDLMQHGLMEISQNSSLVSFGCFPSRSAKIKTKMIHAWDLLLKYYDMKHGREYNDSPARKLSQSFHLDIVGGKAVTAKQTLLGAIGTVISSHTPLKRSEDSHFKAFLCLALNEKKLVVWLRLLYRTQSVIDYYYQDWSYAAKTGFEDALKALERLNTVSFKLPVDLAVRQFSKIKDAF